MTTLPSRAQIDRAEPLPFPERRPEILIAIKATIDGFPTELTFTGTIEQLLATTKRLREIGAQPLIAPAAPQSGGTQAARKPAQRVEPVWNDAGDPMCPVHRRKLSEGAYGLFCSVKATGDQVADRKGYCGLRFSQD